MEVTRSKLSRSPAGQTEPCSPRPGRKSLQVVQGSTPARGGRAAEPCVLSTKQYLRPILPFAVANLEGEQHNGALKGVRVVGGRR